MSFIITIIVLSILKLTFTIGRFLGAKRLNLPVEKFVVGFEWGKPLFSKKFSDVEFIIYPIFFGGFIEYAKDFDPDVKCDKKQKAFLTSTSLIMMLIFSLLLGIIYINFIPTGKYETYVNKLQTNSVLMPNDKILRLNGIEIEGKHTLNKLLQSNRKFDGIVDEELVSYYRNELIKLNKNKITEDEIPAGVEIILPNKISEGKFTHGLDIGNIKLDSAQKVLRDEISDNKLTLKSTTPVRDVAVALADTGYDVILQVERAGEKITLAPIQPDEFGNIGADFEVKTIYTPRSTVLKNIKQSTKFKFEPKTFAKDLTSILTMLLLISVLVLVHEAGHFFAAKMFKIKVERFGFGLPFGPILWQKQCGETLLVVHAFLLGGYVGFPDDDKDNNLPKESPDRFVNKPVYQRLIVVSAGVIANIICAIVIVAMTALLWGKLPTENYQTIVKEIVSKNNISLINSGLQVGDKILKINGSDVNTNYTFQIFAIKSKKNTGRISPFIAEKNLEEIRNLNPKFRSYEILPKGTVVKLPDLIWEQEVLLTDDMLRGYERITDDKFELSKEQIELKDKLVDKKTFTANGDETLADIAYALSDVPSPLDMIVERNGQEIELPAIYSDENGIVGVELDKQRVFVETKTLKTAIIESCNYLYNQTAMLLKGLWQLFSGKVPLDNMHGVVAVVKYGGDVIQQDGFFQGLLLTALISLDLAIVNFLPIPALDGGHAMFLIIEKLYGKPLDEEVLNSIATVGFMFLILLMVIVIYNDVVALATHKI